MALDLSMFSSLIQGFQGISTIQQGAELAVEGANYQAAAFRAAGTLALQGSQYTASTLRRAGDIAIDGAKYEKSVLEKSKKIALQGAEYTAQVYSNAGSAAVAVSNYNRALDEVNTNKQLDVMGRQIKGLFSTNQAIQGASGVSMGSKSYLMVMGDALTNLERQLVQIRGTALQRQQGISMQGELTAVEYVNNANAAKYAGKIAAYNYNNQIVSSDYQARIAKYSYNNQAVAAEYQGQVEQFNMEAKARNAEYQGEIAQYQADVQSAQNIGKMVGNLVSLF